MIKSAIKSVAARSGLLQAVARFRPGNAVILMYHSVLEDPRAQESYLGEISYSREIFRGQMELLARRYHPVSLDDILRFVTEEAELPRRAVAVTFDDGYSDNYEVAAPILKHAGVPATIYATVDCVERRRLPWPSHLRFMFGNTKKEKWTDADGKSWPLSRYAEREAALVQSCNECCKLVGPAQDEYVARLSGELNITVPVESGTLMMDYAQMRSLIQQGHIIGSHTLDHPNMAYVEPETARRELAESKRRLELELKTPITHFAYPCPALSPHWTEQTLVASREAGYATAVTTNPGSARAGDNPL
ncbi:MAG TPA: polysaccharide deacetylase family protein, partial [Candidatus Binatia bacterium]|nr:polysaccharide deacetylase family protein [Candidatus Binatia bacterium]